MKLLKTIWWILIGLLLFSSLLGLTFLGEFWHPKWEENHAWAASSMRAIKSAQELYKERYDEFAPDLEILVRSKILDNTYLGPKDGYLFKIETISPSIWEAIGEPLVFRESGIKYWFMSSKDGELRVQNYRPADINSYSLETGKGELGSLYLLDSLPIGPTELLVSFWLTVLLAGGMGLYIFLTSRTNRVQD